MFGEASRAFELDRNVGTASEALAEAILARDGDAAKRAAAFIVQNAAESPSPLLSLAQKNFFGAEADPGRAQTDVARLRQLLTLAPHNPALWADLARHHASEGHERRALRCMTAALQLAPNHRWMLRIAARFFVHLQDYGTAHHLLATHPRTPKDPWLMAAELACAHVAGKIPKSWKSANEALRYDRYSPTHVSELATAVGMMELEAGNRKQARRFVQRGLVSPTENTLAQVLWAKESKHLGEGLPRLDPLVGARADAFEAVYKLSLQRGDMVDALNACIGWINDEPFAARPRFEMIFVASILDDHERIERMARAVLKTDGKLAPQMELNVIFSELSSQKINAGDDAHLRISSRLVSLREQGGMIAMHATANLALLRYRLGDTAGGNLLYDASIEIARKNGSHESAALASTFRAREALLAGTEDARARLGEATELAERTLSAPTLFYLRKLQALAETPHRASEILSPSSASDFLKARTIVSVGRDAKGFVLTVGRR